MGPDFDEKWDRFRKMLGPEGDDLPVIGVRLDAAVTPTAKIHDVMRKIDGHRAKTGHTFFAT